MKYIISIVLLIVGLTVGYFVGVQSVKEEVELIVSSDKELVTEFVYDTIIKRETVEVPVYLDKQSTKSPKEDTAVFIEELDTLKETILPKDSLKEASDVVIKREQLIETKEIRINYLYSENSDDTLMKKMLGINEVLPEFMLVEFWMSPLDFNGYKCAKSKLILYGMSPQFSYEIFKKNDRFYLQHEAICYELKETQQFLEYKQVNPSVLND